MAIVRPTREETMNRCFVLTALFLIAPAVVAQDANYDESKVGDYVLPDPLVLSNGEKVQDAETWRTRRRPEILKLFEEQVYGRSPPRPVEFFWEERSNEPQALGG